MYHYLDVIIIFPLLYQKQTENSVHENGIAVKNGRIVPTGCQEISITER